MTLVIIALDRWTAGSRPRASSIASWYILWLRIHACKRDLPSRCLIRGHREEHRVGVPERCWSSRLSSGCRIGSR